MLERMDDFFAARLGGYEDMMLNHVEGCREAYPVLAGLLPPGMRTLLDLGCGTGLELGEIFARFPDICVTGIDISPAMLAKLREKYAQKDINLICDSYLARDFGTEIYDAAVSFETMHHWNHAQKREIYSNICRALVPGGCYIESDYMVQTQAEEDFFAAESLRLREEQGIPDGEFYHFDTPLTIENQLKLLGEAGFHATKMAFRSGKTTIITARKC